MAGGRSSSAEVVVGVHSSSEEVEVEVVVGDHSLSEEVEVEVGDHNSSEEVEVVVGGHSSLEEVEVVVVVEGRSQLEEQMGFGRIEVKREAVAAYCKKLLDKLEVEVEEPDRKNSVAQNCKWFARTDCKHLEAIRACIRLHVRT